MTQNFIGKQSEKELLVGNWKPGYYAWKLDNISPVSIRPVESFPVKGQQGIFYLDARTCTGVNR